MSDREKDLVQQIGKLPDKLQDIFLDMASGALMALESMGEKKEAEDDAGETGERSA